MRAGAVKDEANYTLRECSQAGYSCLEAKQAGCKPFECSQAGYSVADMTAAGFDARASEAASFGTCKKAKEAGFTLPEMCEASFTPEEMKQGGYTTREIISALAQAMGFPDRRAIPTVGRYGIRNPMTSRIVNFRTVHAAAASRLPGNDQGQMRSRTLPADGARGAGAAPNLQQ